MCFACTVHCNFQFICVTRPPPHPGTLPVCICALQNHQKATQIRSVVYFLVLVFVFMPSFVRDGLFILYYTILNIKIRSFLKKSVLILIGSTSSGYSKILFVCCYQYAGTQEKAGDIKNSHKLASRRSGTWGGVPKRKIYKTFLLSPSWFPVAHHSMHEWS